MASAQRNRTSEPEWCFMGKGDRKTRRGKIYRGSFGRLRPKDPAKGNKKAAKAARR
jgi:30S ribosomal protein S31